MGMDDFKERFLLELQLPCRLKVITAYYMLYPARKRDDIAWDFTLTPYYMKMRARG